MSRYAVATLAPAEFASFVQILDDRDVVATRAIQESYNDYRFVSSVMRFLNENEPIAGVVVMDEGSSRYEQVILAIESAGLPVLDPR